MHLTTSIQGLDLIEAFEGFSATFYRDIAGVGTIGFGHIGKHAVPGAFLTFEGARNLLREELRDYENDIEHAVSAELQQYQFDAIASWHFNTGALYKSTLLKLLNERRYTLIDDQLMRWNKYRSPHTRQLIVASGLTRRRMCEAVLWNNLPMPADYLRGVDYKSSGAIPSNPDMGWFWNLLAPYRS